MITLVTFGPKFGSPDASPFCMKGMALLKMSGLAHRFEPGDPRKAPKGKIPYIIEDGMTLGDTTLIRLHLEEKHCVDFYPGLAASEKAVAWAFEKMCEEHLYFCALYERWMVDENFDKGPKQFFEIVPAILRPVVVAKVRRDVRQALHGQGIGRHTRSEIHDLARRDIRALSDFLGEKTYFMGETLTGADAVVHSFVMAGIAPLFEGPLMDAITAHPNLVAYADRLAQLWYDGTDWETSAAQSSD